MSCFRIRLLAAGCAVLTAAFAPAAAQTPPGAVLPAVAARAMTAEAWREDLRFLAGQIEARHKDPFHTVSRARFAQAVAALDARIPVLQRHEIIVEMMRIAALIGDGHTNISPLKDKAFGFRSLPLKLYLFDDGLHVRAARPEYAGLLGARIEAIGGVPVEEALRRVGEISARDNMMGLKFYAPILLAMPEVQHALKLSPRADTSILTLRKDGRTFQATVSAGEVDPSWPPDTDISLITPEGWLDARGTAPQPLWLQAPLDYHRMVDLPADRALYVQLNMVTGIKDQTLEAFAGRIRARAVQTNPRAIILDVRLNRGGNNALRYPLVRDLIKAEDDDTRLYVLSGRGAFSATQAILEDLERYSEAVLVGEPASSKPSSFGDSYRVVLPNSGLTARISIKWWQTEQDFRPFTPIDVAAPLTFGDYAAGGDPALKAALGYTPPPSLGEGLLAAARAGGIPEVRRALAAWLDDPVNRYADTERQLVIAAQSLHRAELTEAAIAAAHEATRRLPDRPVPALVLAFIAEAAKQPALALEAAERALKLEPDNREARGLLERLKAQQPPATK